MKTITNHKTINGIRHELQILIDKKKEQSPLSTECYKVRLSCTISRDQRKHHILRQYYDTQIFSYEEEADDYIEDWVKDKKKIWKNWKTG